MFELFEHTADLGLRVRAESVEGLFADAGRALFAVIVANSEDVRPVETHSLQLAGDADEYLLFDWLNELLYLHATRQLLLSQFEVRFDAAGLHATVRGEPIDRDRHNLEHEVKAITYHGLTLEQRPGEWFAEVVVDI